MEGNIARCAECGKRDLQDANGKVHAPPNDYSTTHNVVSQSQSRQSAKTKPNGTTVNIKVENDDPKINIDTCTKDLDAAKFDLWNVSLPRNGTNTYRYNQLEQTF